MFSPTLLLGWRGSLHSKLGGLAIANAVAIVLCLAYLLQAGAKMDTSSMMLAYFVAAVPFVLSGTILSLAIADTIKRVDRVYFFDLLGAAAGCAVLVPLLKWVGGPNTILVAAVVFAVSAAIWFHRGASARAGAFSPCGSACCWLASSPITTNIF